MLADATSFPIELRLDRCSLRAMQTEGKVRAMGLGNSSLQCLTPKAFPLFSSYDCHSFNHNGEASPNRRLSPRVHCFICL